MATPFLVRHGMSMRMNGYKSFADFEREEIRPGLRAGWTLDSIHDPLSVDHDFDQDPFEALLQAAEYEEESVDLE